MELHHPRRESTGRLKNHTYFNVQKDKFRVLFTKIRWITDTPLCRTLDFRTCLNQSADKKNTIFLPSRKTINRAQVTLTLEASGVPDLQSVGSQVDPLCLNIGQKYRFFIKNQETRVCEHQLGRRAV